MKHTQRHQNLSDLSDGRIEHNFIIFTWVTFIFYGTKQDIRCNWNLLILKKRFRLQKLYWEISIYLSIINSLNYVILSYEIPLNRLRMLINKFLYALNLQHYENDQNILHEWNVANLTPISIISNSFNQYSCCL